VTTTPLFAPDERASGRFIAKQSGVIAGLEIAGMVFVRVARYLLNAAQISEEATHEVSFIATVADGDRVEAGATIATISGSARIILAGERLALNFLQRLSGIATLTRRFVEAVGADTPAIMDTRKTTPCWRDIEKYAVRVGGGVNHRMGLYDMALLKDNHLKLKAIGGNAAALKEAVEKIRTAYPTVKVEIEADTIETVRAAIDAGADIVMLDNMSVEQMKEAVALAAQSGGNRPLIEASGGITLDNIGEVAQTGVDRISIGALTHSAPALDISLELDTPAD